MNGAVPQAAGITGLLAAAGLGEREIAHWFDTTRRELDGFTPRGLLRLAPSLPYVGEVVLQLVKADIRALEIDRKAAAL